MSASNIIQRFEYKDVGRLHRGKLEKLHLVFMETAREIEELCPVNRDTSLSLTRLEESLHWAVEAVKRGQEEG